MKKCMILLFLALLLGGCSAACPVIPETADMPEFDGADQGVRLQCQDPTENGVTLVFTSICQEERITGTPYSLEMFTTTGWLPVDTRPPEDRVAWNDLAWLINPQGETRMNEEWTWLYGKLSDGYYRISKEIYGNGESSVVYGYFAIGE